MDMLLKLQSSARPFVSDIQKELARHWSNDLFKHQQDPNNDLVNFDDSDIGQLPLEVKHAICSFMTSTDLVRLSMVSSTWNYICNDDSHWHRVFNEEKFKWDCIQNCKGTHLSFWQKITKASANVSANVSDYLFDVEDMPPNEELAVPAVPIWKTTFLLNRLANTLTKLEDTMSLNRDVEEPTSTRNQSNGARGAVLSNLGNVANVIRSGAPVLATKFASRISPMVGQLKVPFQKIHRIPMLGEGLESTSKDLLYSMMWPHNTMFKLTGLYPGVEGIGSGVGFCVDDVNLNIAALHRCQLDDLRIKWRSYFQKVDGVIYVVSCKHLPKDEERRQLKLIVSGDEPLVPPTVPLLILLVCDDERAVRVRPSELAEQLNVDNLDREWCIQLVDMHTLKGLPEGLKWLAHKV